MRLQEWREMAQEMTLTHREAILRGLAEKARRRRAAAERRVPRSIRKVR